MELFLPSALFALVPAGLAFLHLRRKLPFAFFSPVWLFVGFYYLTACTGFYVYGYTDWGSGIMSGVGSLVDFRQLQTAFVCTLWIITAFLMGATTVALPRPASAGRLGGMRPLDRRISAAVEHRVQRRGARLVLTLAAVPLLFLVVGVGPSNLITRVGYLPMASLIAKIVGLVFSPIANLALGALFARRSTFLTRGAALGLHLVYLTVFFALASRSGGVTAILFAVGMLMARPGSKTVKALFALWLLLAGALIGLALMLRSQYDQGLLPFVEVLIASGTDLAEHPSGLSFGLFMFLNIFAATIPVATYVMDATPLTASLFATSVNPLPGVMTDWYQNIGSFLVTPTVPYNAIGELLNYGLPVALIYFWLVGMLLAHVDYRIRGCANRQQIVQASILFGLSVLFIITSSQYPLRATTRVVYYLLAFNLAFVLVRLATRARRKATEHGRPGSPPATGSRGSHGWV